MIFNFTDMRRDVQEIFRNTPHGKQVMMFSATLSKEIRPVCKKFMQDVSGQPIYLKQTYYHYKNQNKIKWGMGGECFKMGSRLITVLS